jgi:hypothetical protein
LRPFEILRAVSTVERLEAERGIKPGRLKWDPAAAGLQSSGALFRTG